MIQPHDSDIAAEQELLGAILTNNIAGERVRDVLAAEHFAHPIHARIYDSIRIKIDRREAVTPVTLATHFKNDPDFEELGGPNTYFARLAGAATTVLNARDYAQLIRSSWLARAAEEITEETTARLRENSAEDRPEDIIEEMLGRGMTLLEGSQNRQAVSFSTSMDMLFTEIDEASKGIFNGCSTGLSDLDKLVNGGLHDTDLVVLGGRPGMGKTALACAIARAAQGRGVGFFSLEMSASQLSGRLLSLETGVSYQAIRSGQISRDQMGAITRARAEMSQWRIWTDDSSDMDIEKIRVRARRLKRVYDVGLIIVDHLHLVSASPHMKRAGMVDQIGHVSANLKRMAKELKVPVLALAQLNRGVEGRDNKRPTMADIRASGSIEQDADQIMLLYREEYYLKKHRPDEPDGDWYANLNRSAGKAQVILGKNRHGPEGTETLDFDGETMRFSDQGRVF